MELIGPHSVERTVPLSNRTLACLWTLSNQETFRGVADRFGLSKGSLHYYLMNFCRMMTQDSILSQMICWPKRAREYQLTAGKSAERAGVPYVIGIYPYRALWNTEIHPFAEKVFMQCTCKVCLTVI